MPEEPVGCDGDRLEHLEELIKQQFLTTGDRDGFFEEIVSKQNLLPNKDVEFVHSHTSSRALKNFLGDVLLTRHGLWRLEDPGVRSYATDYTRLADGRLRPEFGGR